MSRRRRSKQISAVTDLALPSAALLVAIAVIPNYFNIMSSRSFEPDKSALIRTLALIVAAGLLPAIVHHIRARELPQWSTISLPVKCLVLICLVSTLSTLFGVDPVTSFWGSHERGYGLLSLLAGMGFITAAYQLLRACRLWLLVDAILIAALIPALYGLSQVGGYDPVIGRSLSFELGLRASSTLGNPLYLANFLLLVTILALARLLLNPPDNRGAKLILVMYCLLLALAFAATLSRSALLAALASATFFLVYWGYQRQNLLLRMAGFSFLALATLLLGMAWIAPQFLPPRLNDLFASGGTGGQRLLFWQAVFDLLRTEPRYLLTGIGMDVLPFKLGAYLPAELAHFEPDWVFRIPDRAHTLPLELLSANGVVALILWVLLWASLLTRLLPSYSKRPHFPLGCQLAGAGIGAVAATVLVGIHASPLGLSAGLLGGALLALLVAPTAPSKIPPTDLRALYPFLLAALVGHWTLLAFSFPTHAPDLLIWVIIGMALAVTDIAKNSTSMPAEASDRLSGNNYFQIGGIAVALFLLSTAAAWQAALVLVVVAAFAGYGLVWILSPSGTQGAEQVLWFIVPALTLLPAMLLNRQPGVASWLAYTWLLLWLLAQIALLLPKARHRSALPMLAILTPILLLLNLPAYGDIAYKSALLNLQDAKVRNTWSDRALWLSPYDHIMAAGMAFVESGSVNESTILNSPSVDRVNQLYELATRAQPLAPEPFAFYAEWLRTRAKADEQVAAKSQVYFSRALDLAPQNLQVRNQQALLFWQQGDAERAIADLQVLLRRDPLYGPTYLNLAEIQERTGDIENARATLQRGIEQVPWWDALPVALDKLEP